MNNTEITELKSDLLEEEELNDADLSTVVGGTGGSIGGSGDIDGSSGSFGASGNTGGSPLPDVGGLLGPVMGGLPKLPL